MIIVTQDGVLNCKLEIQLNNWEIHWIPNVLGQNGWFTLAETRYCNDGYYFCILLAVRSWWYFKYRKTESMPMLVVENPSVSLSPTLDRNEKIE